jgi:hypothetical protein
MRLLFFGLFSAGAQAQQCSTCQPGNYSVVSASSPNPDMNSQFASVSPDYGFGAYVGYMCGQQYCAARPNSLTQFFGWSCNNGPALGTVTVQAFIGGTGAVSEYELERGVTPLTLGSSSSDCLGNRSGGLWPVFSDC